MAALTAPFCIERLTAPARPPLINPPIAAALPDLEPLPELIGPEPLRPPPKCRLEALRTVDSPFVAIRASAIILPPVCPTLTPRLAINESIFWDILRKLTAHKNQINTFPATASFPAESTWVCTSPSVTAAKAVWQDRKRRTVTTRTAGRALHRAVNHKKPFWAYSFFTVDKPPYTESGLAINAPTILVKSRRHQAFIIKRNTCPPSIRHHDLKIFDVAWDAPMENATGAV